MEKIASLSRHSRGIDRRSFLKLSGMMGVGIVSTGIIPVKAEAVKFNNKMYKVSRTRLAMGTFVSMTLMHPSRDRAEEAMGLAFEEIDRLTGLMNRFDEGTAVGQLNREGLLKDLPPEVTDVISRSIHYYLLSNGSFDISVKPVVDLFKTRITGGKKAVPSDTELKQALSLIGSDKIQLNGNAIRFKKPGMGITLDGIAKGYIVDSASNMLVKHRIQNHLINAGGDIRTMGTKQDKKPWTVAVQDPQKKKRYPDIIKMANGAIATSGDYEIYYDREKMFHHIVDPKTGLSPRVSTSVSVLAPTAIEADALSTSVFVMTPKQGAGFIDTVPKCECLVISREGTKIKSTGWNNGIS